MLNMCISAVKLVYLCGFTLFLSQPLADGGGGTIHFLLVEVAAWFTQLLKETNGLVTSDYNFLGQSLLVTDRGEKRTFKILTSSWNAEVCASLRRESI